MSKRIIYYYQTFNTLGPILDDPKVCGVTHIHLSAVHFGNNDDGSPYIHLNNYPPTDNRFNKVWKELEEANKKGIKIVLMVGGAGSAYNVLFSNFKVYYKLLYDTFKSYTILPGIDLDIEEEVSLDNTKMLINRLRADFSKDFIISMAPIQNSLQTDEPGMGGFIYKDLYNSPEGKQINYFNGQFYFDYSSNAYKQCIENGYPASKVVMGMISYEDYENTLDVIKELLDIYPDLGGVYNWEYFSSPPGEEKNPEEWAKGIDSIMNPKLDIFVSQWIDNILNYFKTPF